MDTMNIQQLRALNACPLLYQQHQLYQKENLASRSISTALQKAFNQILYFNMRGHVPSKRTMTSLWKEAMVGVAKAVPTVTDKDFEFPAQCFSVFWEKYSSFDERVFGIDVPFTLFGKVSDNIPLLTRGPFGTRITVFTWDRFCPSELRLTNDIFYGLYSMAHRQETKSKESFLTVFNLGDGVSKDLFKTDDDLETNAAQVTMLLESVNSNVPNEAMCPHCPIQGPCHFQRYAGRR